jgi:hypothetical protein
VLIQGEKNGTDNSTNRSVVTINRIAAMKPHWTIFEMTTPTSKQVALLMKPTEPLMVLKLLLLTLMKWGP